jgi:hypothetical protein
VVGTSVLRQAVTTGRRLTLLNRHATSARCGLILSGAAGTGKTTAITYSDTGWPPRSSLPGPAGRIN